MLRKSDEDVSRLKANEELVWGEAEAVHLVKTGFLQRIRESIATLRSL